MQGLDGSPGLCPASFGLDHRPLLLPHNLKIPSGCVEGRGMGTARREGEARLLLHAPPAPALSQRFTPGVWAFHTKQMLTGCPLGSSAPLQ